MSLPTLKIGQHQTQSAAAQQDLWQAIKNVISLQNQAPPLVPVSRDNSLPLSFPQERLWFLHQLEPNRASAYNIPLGLRITGTLDISALQNSLNEILRRHEALRTTFSCSEGKPIQVIHPPTTFAFSIVDLQNLPQQQRETAALKLIQAETKKTFDLTQLPLIRGTLFQLEEEQYILLFTVHHIIVDAWSKGVLFQELTTLYTAFANGQPLPLTELTIQYADFAFWQRQSLPNEFQELLLNYWKQQLGSNLRELNIPTDRSRPAVPKCGSAYKKLILSPELTKGLKGLSRQEGATLFVTLLAAFKVLLYRYTEQEDLFVCSPIANRNRKDIKPLIGYFINLLIFRTQLNPHSSFQILLSEVRKVASGGFAHQDLPVQQLINSLNLLQTPLSRVMFALQNTAVHTLQLPGMAVQNLDLDCAKADFDLYLYLIEEGDTLAAVLKYNTDLFDETTIAQMLGNYKIILDNIVHDPGQTVLSLLPLSIEEQQQLQAKRVKQLDKSNPIPRTYIAPRNAVELKLTQIWSQVLGIDSIGVQDNFFELGGQSLVAMSLFTQIEQAFGQTLPLGTLIQAPTIEQLAQILSQATGSVSWSSLVPIQTQGTKPPFFCVHGQQGNVLNFRELVHYLGEDQPFYGLQAQGLDGKQAPYFRIEDMAAHYIQEIRTIQPKGPYYLGGNSMGGTIAFEMAQQLQQQGEEVAVLVMFDTFNQGAFPRLSFRQQHYWAYLWQLGLSLDLLAELGELLQRQFQTLICHLYLRSGMSLPANLRRMFVPEANMQAKRAYTAQVYSAERDRIILFRATEPAVFSKRYLPTLEDWENRDPLHGWGELAGAGLEIHDVPGDHYSIFAQPHVQTLATKLRACLATVKNL
ncbi:condensation domain-containing protein [Nostoc sp. UHCC 0870]|uniref:condensation domain-containing protein n=1 Tax=Nostoc sp. UHCC 0870 TaxID=2914041 RepID=UPI001EE0DFE4|nr:condensation domain-containing protein [Nostoc sp. UHCC 0870]UKO99747.1 condensation domain-containing protein [Nostoc sp. UHCC 0870]